MDNEEKTAPAESGRGYTIDELLAKMEPQYRAYKNTIRECIAGLTTHDAQLAVRGREEQLPMIREMIVEMAEFWGLAGADTPKAFQEMTEQYRDTFEQTVSAAKDSDHAPELSDHAKTNILAGLELYAHELENNGDLGHRIDECNVFAAQLREEWRMEVPQEDMPQNDTVSRKRTENVETYIGATVESFLRSHPNAELDMMSAYGFVYLTPEAGQVLLNGGEVSAHPGDPEYAINVPADEILCQQISSISSDADNPNLYAMLTVCPELDECMNPQIEPQGQQFGGM